MVKLQKILAMLFVFALLLSGCGDKYLTYEQTVKKLEDAGFTVNSSTDADEIKERIAQLTSQYNSYVQNHEDEGLSFIPIDSIKVEKLIEAEKGDSSVAYIYYCKDEESAVKLSNVFITLYSTSIGEHCSGQDGNFFYIYTADVNEILQFMR